MVNFEMRTRKKCYDVEVSSDCSTNMKQTKRRRTMKRRSEQKDNPRLVSLEERPVLNGLTSFPESETSPRSSSGSNDIVQPRLARASSFGVPSYMEAVEKEIIAALSDLLDNDKKITLVDVVDIEQILKHSEMTTQAFLQADRDQRSRLIQQELKKFRKGR
ncbi:hypothetical protein HanXRQr2_Chr05g0216281 [Helianthus annuus]|uniref:Uncharacterized protein n=1 Tax=Helianthus annuus TaxID=4232 RepID=A0A251URH4_HELAN|nr:uncharacterized protein LOC110939083 [Helianthus annuus]KAF5806010.1 hypothetical protein HanXRQr2_Chr05g0216281 [Helianthus annuus]KAJ0584684.1 hypothetical protein HanHA89_Chr05g0191561 [Helianthus annuus]KAJ0750351.1 hypothetical protein HanLR1_Chr05g0180991 [Helianthus annuus]KAJ0922867.1 hypothetical protein HanPSC8_Chr05g0208881 [Helianthus annuus]